MPTKHPKEDSSDHNPSFQPILSAEVRRIFESMQMPMSPEAEERIMNEWLLPFGAISGLLFLEPPYSSYHEWQAIFDPSALERDYSIDDRMPKIVKLRNETYYRHNARIRQQGGNNELPFDNTFLSLAMGDLHIKEICAMGLATKSLYRDEPYEDSDDLVRQIVKERAWGIFGVLGLKREKTIMLPKMKVRKIRTGEQVLMHRDLVRNGKDCPACSIQYRAYQSTEGRPGVTTIEIILPQEIAELAFLLIQRDPKLIRRIVAKFLENRFGITPKKWMHGDSTQYFGLAYDAWPKPTKMYIHGPDAKEGFHTEYLREIQ